MGNFGQRRCLTANNMYNLESAQERRKHGFRLRQIPVVMSSLLMLTFFSNTPSSSSFIAMWKKHLKRTYYAHFQHLFLFLDSTRVALHDSEFKIIPCFNTVQALSSTSGISYFNSLYVNFLLIGSPSQANDLDGGWVRLRCSQPELCYSYDQDIQIYSHYKEP